MKFLEVILKVNYFFVGPRKTGTSWLDFYLNKASEIGMPYTRKEIEYFNNNFSKSLNWYHGNYRPKFKYHGDCSPSYFSSISALTNIKKYNPDAKIIVTIRDPFKRTISHFKMDREHNGNISWDKFLSSSLFKDSFYYEQIKYIFSIFKKDHVLIIKYEDLFNPNATALRKLNKFLNISIDENSMKELQNRKVYEDKGTPRSRFFYLIARRIASLLYFVRFRWLIKVLYGFGVKKIFYKEDNFDYESLDFNPVKELLNNDILKTQQLLINNKLDICLQDYILE